MIRGGPGYGRKFRNMEDADVRTYKTWELVLCPWVNSLVRRMGHRNLFRYWRSPRWREIRKKVLEKDNYKCKCGKTAVKVRPLWFSKNWMMGRDLIGLISLCKDCYHRR